MATKARTLLLLSLSLLLLYSVTAFSRYLSLPSNNDQPNNESNQNENESDPTANDVNGTEFGLLNPDEIKNMFCNLGPAWPTKYKNDVVMLTGKNFSDFLAKNRNVLVFFYIYWCPPCEKMAVEYAAAAKMLKGEAAVAMVDAFVEDELIEKHNITEYPMVYLFVGGVKLHRFVTERRRDIISAWVRRKIALGPYRITTMDEAERILTAESKLVLGFLGNVEGSESEELAAASKLHSDINFYQTASADVAELFHMVPKHKRPALIFLRIETGEASMFHGQFTRSAIADYVSNLKHPLVVTLTMGNAELVFQNPMKQLWLFAPAYGSQKVISTFEEIAKEFKGKLLPVYVEMNSEGVGKQVCHEFGISTDTPRVIAYSTHDAKKFVLNGDLTLSSIKSFAEDFLEDKLSGQLDQISETILKLPSNSRVSYQLRSHA